MKALCCPLTVTTLLAGLLATTGVAATPVPEPERASLLRWVIPLPKRIAIDSKVKIPASEVKLTLVGTPGRAATTAAEQLRLLFKEKAGIVVVRSANKRKRTFEIVLGVCDTSGRLGSETIAAAAKLAELPNAQQAYVIQPVGENRLVLAALDPRGVYYAARTLHQLLESQFHDGRVSIPLARVTDWPDLEERGLWGGSANRDIEWMARHKMNLVESHVTLGLTGDGRGHAQADQELIDLGRDHALKFVPVITHLNGLGRTGIYRAHPELKGKGDRAVHPTHTELVAPCCSQPKLVGIVADWMSALGGQEGVTDVCAWLSELHNQYCGCESCLAQRVGQYALEARVLVEAWRIAQKECPDLGLRVLLTQGSYQTNDKVLAEIPPGVGVTYYDGGRTYDSSREPMIYPLLESYTARGAWLGCYPQLTASYRVVCPWSGPQFIKARMSEFVQKKLKCLCGYATPDSRLYEFNVTAAAEWSWNSRGRDEREFARAYWTRKGARDVEAAADWAVMLGPVGWDVYGSGIPAHNFFGPAARLVARRAKPELGVKGMFRYFATPEHFEHDLAVCDKAMAIALRLDEPPLIAETQVIHGYVRMAEAIYAIAERAGTSKRPSYDERVVLQQALGKLTVAAVETADALQRWEKLCRKDPDVGMGARFDGTVDATTKTAVDIAQALEPLGIRKPVGPFLREEIGQWVTDDFDEAARLTKSFDVTKLLGEPGVYHVGFKYTGGWNGLRIGRVALASAPDSRPDQLTELSVDEHVGSAANRNVANEYTLTLERHEPETRFFVVADITGVPRKGRPPERQGCNGSVWLARKIPADWRSRIERTRPLTDEELADR